MKTIMIRSLVMVGLFFATNTLLAQTGLTVTGTVDASTLSVTSITNVANMTFTGTISGGTFSGTLSSGTLNGITSIGQLSTLSVTGNVDLATITSTATTVNIANGVSGNTVSIANGINTSAQTINIGAGANAANNTINIGSGTNTAGVVAVTIGTNTNFANTTLIKGGSGTGAIALTPQLTGAIVIGAITGTGAITLGSSAGAGQTVNIGSGNTTGSDIINIGTGTATASKTINIATGAISTVNIGSTGAFTSTVNIGTGTLTPTINIGTATGATVNIASGAFTSTVLIGNATGNTKTGFNIAASTAILHLGAGKATANAGAPLKFTSGTNLTTAEAGAMEYDGVNTYMTNETTAGRGAIPVEQHFKLTAAGTAITQAGGIANYFGTTSNIPLVTNGLYEIDIYAYYLNTTAGTVTWTFTNSVAPTAMDLFYDLSPIAGIVSTAAATTLFGAQYNLTTTAPTVVTGSLTTLVNHYNHFKIFLNNATGTSLKIQVTKATGGSITPGIGSRWFCKRLPASNTGAFAN